jgi:hypothetical protein
MLSLVHSVSVETADHFSSALSCHRDCWFRAFVVTELAGSKFCFQPFVTNPPFALGAGHDVEMPPWPLHHNVENFAAFGI